MLILVHRMQANMGVLFAVQATLRAVRRTVSMAISSACQTEMKRHVFEKIFAHRTDLFAAQMVVVQKIDNMEKNYVHQKDRFRVPAAVVPKTEMIQI